MPTPTPLTRKQVREVDRLAIEEFGIPGVVLMENAGRNATDIIQRFMQTHEKELKSALIICGGGNNGGDGYVIARHLHNRGVQIHILAHKPIEQLTGDAAINARICQHMDLKIQPANSWQALLQHACSPKSSSTQPDLIIDALLGTGFTGDLRPDLQDLIQAINATRDPRKSPQKSPQKSDPDTSTPPVIVAIDLPSGLDCDTGQPPDPPDPPDHPAQVAVIADLTITFVAPKLGFSQPAAWPYVGKFEVADIGAPPELIEKACL